MVPKQIISRVALVGVVGIVFGGVMKLAQKAYRSSQAKLTQRNAGKPGGPDVRMVPLSDDDYEADPGHKKPGGAA